MRINRTAMAIFLGLLVIACGKKQDVQDKPDLAVFSIDVADNEDAPFTDSEDTIPEIREVLETYIWSLPIAELMAIEFRENRYSLRHFAPGGQSFCWGSYEIDGLRVRLNFPDMIDKQLLGLEPNQGFFDWMIPYQRAYEWLFPGEDTIEFIFDADYVDFYVASGLRYGDEILRNYALRSPDGEKYVLDGIEVIKYDGRTNHIIVRENLRMREGPSINFPTVNLDVYIVGLDKEFSGYLLYKNSVNSFDAVTIKKDIIGGIEAPWYRVNVMLDEIYTQNVWVFGGYVERIPEKDSEKNIAEYYRNYYATLFQLGVIE